MIICISELKCNIYPLFSFMRSPATYPALDVNVFTSDLQKHSSLVNINVLHMNTLISLHDRIDDHFIDCL
jgi:hypothetical protein